MRKNGILRIVVELKKGFFRSDEQEQKLTYEKEELREAKNALSEVKKEIEENRHCRLNVALAGTDDEGLESLLNFMESIWIGFNGDSTGVGDSAKK